jgi:hypothetical protein
VEGTNSKISEVIASSPLYFSPFTSTLHEIEWKAGGSPGHDVPRSKVAPRLASRVPRNRSDALRKDPTVPRNAETVPGNIHRPPGPVPFWYVLGSWPSPTLKARLAQPGLT